MRHQNRKAQILKRKNFLPTLVVTIFLWLITAGVVYFVDPQTFGAIELFFLLVFLTILFTFSLIFAASRRGLIAAVTATSFLILAYLGVGNILNFLLLSAIAVCIELYLSYK